MRVLALDRATAQASEHLRTAGIPTLLLKGPAVSRWLYPDESVRPYDDADLLAPPQDYERAQDVLGEIGFRRMGLDALPANRASYALTLRRPDDGLAIDLHHTFVGIGADDAATWRALFADAEPMSVAGADVLVPSTPARALLLGLHAAKDGARAHRVLHDLARAIAVVPEDVWRSAATLADDLAATEAFASGLRRIPAGAELARRLGLSEAVTPDVALREDRPPPLAVGMKWVLEERSLRRRIRVVRHKLFPSAEFLRAWRPIARRGPVGLAVAYLWRPFWVVWHALPALAAVRRAERRARRSSV